MSNISNSYFSLGVSTPNDDQENVSIKENYFSPKRVFGLRAKSANKSSLKGAVLRSVSPNRGSLLGGIASPKPSMFFSKQKTRVSQASFDILHDPENIDQNNASSSSVTTNEGKINTPQIDAAKSQSTIMMAPKTPSTPFAHICDNSNLLNDSLCYSSEKNAVVSKSLLLSPEENSNVFSQSESTNGNSRFNNPAFLSAFSPLSNSGSTKATNSTLITSSSLSLGSEHLKSVPMRSSSVQRRESVSSTSSFGPLLGHFSAPRSRSGSLTTNDNQSVAGESVNVSVSVKETSVLEDLIETGANSSALHILRTGNTPKKVTASRDLSVLEQAIGESDRVTTESKKVLLQGESRPSLLTSSMDPMMIASLQTRLEMFERENEALRARLTSTESLNSSLQESRATAAEASIRAVTAERELRTQQSQATHLMASALRADTLEAELRKLKKKEEGHLSELEMLRNKNTQLEAELSRPQSLHSPSVTSPSGNALDNTVMTLGSVHFSPISRDILKDFENEYFNELAAFASPIPASVPKSTAPTSARHENRVKFADSEIEGNNQNLSGSFLTAATLRQALLKAESRVLMLEAEAESNRKYIMELQAQLKEKQANMKDRATMTDPITTSAPPNPTVTSKSSGTEQFADYITALVMKESARELKSARMGSQGDIELTFTPKKSSRPEDFLNFHQKNEQKEDSRQISQSTEGTSTEDDLLIVNSPIDEKKSEKDIKLNLEVDLYATKTTTDSDRDRMMNDETMIVDDTGSTPIKTTANTVSLSMTPTLPLSSLSRVDRVERLSTITRSASASATVGPSGTKQPLDLKQLPLPRPYSSDFDSALHFNCNSLSERAENARFNAFVRPQSVEDRRPSINDDMIKGRGAIKAGDPAALARAERLLKSVAPSSSNHTRSASAAPAVHSNTDTVEERLRDTLQKVSATVGHAGITIMKEQPSSSGAHPRSLSTPSSRIPSKSKLPKNEHNQKMEKKHSHPTESKDYTKKKSTLSPDLLATPLERLHEILTSVLAELERDAATGRKQDPGLALYRSNVERAIELRARELEEALLEELARQRKNMPTTQPRALAPLSDVSVPVPGATRHQYAEKEVSKNYLNRIPTTQAESTASRPTTTQKEPIRTEFTQTKAVSPAPKAKPAPLGVMFANRALQSPPSSQKSGPLGFGSSSLSAFPSATLPPLSQQNYVNTSSYSHSARAELSFSEALQPKKAFTPSRPAHQHFSSGLARHAANDVSHGSVANDMQADAQQTLMDWTFAKNDQSNSENEPIEWVTVD